MGSEPFAWRGEEIKTMGGILRAAEGIIERDDADEAKEFMDVYRAYTKHADSNIGYGLGYLGHDMMVRGLRLFNLEHPVFGDADSAAGVMPEDAFEAGVKLGQQLRDAQG